MFFQTLLLVCLVSTAVGDTVNLNELMDQTIASLQEVIRQEGKDEIVLPEIHEEWPIRKAWFKMTVNLNCVNGIVRSLASIRRTGDTTMTTEGNKLILRTQLGLGDLDANFENCQLKIHRLGSISHKIEISVDSNSIYAEISLTGQGAACVASLDKIELNQLGKININTGGGLFNKVIDKVLEIVARHFHEQAVSAANDALSDAATKALPKADLCNKIPH